LLGSDEFEVQGRLGSGSFGDVYKVRLAKDGGAYAVKRMRRPFRGVNDRKEVLGENMALAAMGESDFCVRHFKSWEHDGSLCILMELCDRGTLEDYLRKWEVPEPTVWAFFADLALGVKHIHAKGFVHFDIKPANIFLASTGKLKIGDFGLAVKARRGAVTLERDGDPVYLAPEALDKQLGAPGFPADIFSLGVVLLEMAADVRLPPNGVEWQRLRSGVIDCLEDIDRSDELKFAIRSAMARKPATRPTAAVLARGFGLKNLTVAISNTLAKKKREIRHFPACVEPAPLVPVVPRASSYPGAAGCPPSIPASASAALREASSSARTNRRGDKKRPLAALSSPSLPRITAQAQAEAEARPRPHPPQPPSPRPGGGGAREGQEASPEQGPRNLFEEFSQCPVANET